MRTKLSALAAAALLLGACSSAGDDTAADPTTSAGTAAPAPSAGATAPSPGASALAAPAPVSADLPDGVAAEVGDVEITTAELEERLGLVTESPQVQEQLESGDAAQVEARLSSQILSQLIVQEAVLQGAAEEGIEITDAQVEEQRAELVATVGSEEQLQERMAQAGIPESELADDLRAGLAFEEVGKTLVDGDTPTTAPSDAPSGAPDPVQIAQQQWLMDLFGQLDIAVDESIGGWDATTGSVVPA